MIEGYLLGRDELVQIFVLVDGEIGPTKLDVQMLDWLRDESLPHSVVATKMDKVKSSVRDRRKRELAAGCMLEPRRHRLGERGEGRRHRRAARPDHDARHVAARRVAGAPPGPSSDPVGAPRRLPPWP